MVPGWEMERQDVDAKGHPDADTDHTDVSCGVRDSNVRGGAGGRGGARGAGNVGGERGERGEGGGVARAGGGHKDNGSNSGDCGDVSSIVETGGSYMSGGSFEWNTLGRLQQRSAGSYVTVASSPSHDAGGGDGRTRTPSYRGAAEAQDEEDRGTFGQATMSMTAQPFDTTNRILALLQPSMGEDEAHEQYRIQQEQQQEHQQEHHPLDVIAGLTSAPSLDAQHPTTQPPIPPTHPVVAAPIVITLLKAPPLLASLPAAPRGWTHTQGGGVQKDGAEDGEFAGGAGPGREKAGGAGGEAGGAAGGASGDLAVAQDRRLGTTTVVSTVVDTNTKKRMRLTEVRLRTPCLNCYRLLWKCRLV